MNNELNNDLDNELNNELNEELSLEVSPEISEEPNQETEQAHQPNRNQIQNEHKDNPQEDHQKNHQDFKQKLKKNSKRKQRFINAKETILKKQRKTFYLTGLILGSVLLILMVTYFRSGKQEENQSILSQEAKAYDVTQKISDESYWMHKSERLLDQAVEKAQSAEAKTEEQVKNIETLKQSISQNETEAKELKEQVRKQNEAILSLLSGKGLSDTLIKEFLQFAKEPSSSNTSSSPSSSNLPHPSNPSSKGDGQWRGNAALPGKVVNKSYLPGGTGSKRGVQQISGRTDGQGAARGNEEERSEGREVGGIYVEKLNLRQIEISDREKFPTSKEVIPAGSFARGILLNGVDVSTGNFAKEHPASLTIRLVDQGSLPNEVVGDMNDCRITASAFGHRSNERAEIRIEKLTCIQEDDRVISTDVTGYIVGSDGKQGVRGKLIRRGNELLWQSAWSKFMSNMASAASNAAGTSVITPQGAIRTFSTKEAIRSSSMSGVGGALDRLADQAIKELDEIKPIIQISASLPVDVVFNENSKFGSKKQIIPQSPNQLADQVNQVLRQV